MPTPWSRTCASNGIRYRRNDPDTSAAAAIREANSGYYDFYLALHSNAIGNGEPQTTARGIIAFYYPGSSGGQRGAELIAENLREIYPLPDKVTTRDHRESWRGVPLPVSGGAGGNRLPRQLCRCPCGWRAMWKPLPSSLSGR